MGLAWALLLLSLLQWTDQGFNSNRVLYWLGAPWLMGAHPDQQAVLHALQALRVASLLAVGFLGRWLWKRFYRSGVGAVVAAVLVLTEGTVQSKVCWRGIQVQQSGGDWGGAVLLGLSFAALLFAGWLLQSLSANLFLVHGNLRAYGHLAQAPTVKRRGKRRRKP